MFRAFVSERRNELMIKLIIQVDRKQARRKTKIRISKRASVRYRIQNVQFTISRLQKRKS